MPIYELAPLYSSDPDWSASTFEGKCRVHAPNEDRARAYVDREFRIATAYVMMMGPSLSRRG